MTRNDTNEKSRSQKKRESTAAQRFGRALSALPVSDLRTMGIQASLLDAILDWKKFPGREAKRRQMQYIGRLMRDMDIAEPAGRLEALLAPSREETQALHEVEMLRDRLVNVDDAALETELAALAALYPALPLARLRHLSVAAREERAKKRHPPKACRELFRCLKDLRAQRT